jgi:cytochrome c-type biogenesis protein CcsB
MATASYYLYIVAGLLIVGAFAAHVAHTALLAAGRRVAAPRRLPATPAFAGVVTGSFAKELEARASEETAARGATAAGPVAIGLAWSGAIVLGLSLLARGIVVGRGPWGNLFEFTVAFAFGTLVAYLLLERRHPIRAVGVVPLGLALGLVAYSWTLPQEIEALVPALQHPPLLTIHVGLAMVSYGILAMSFAAAVGYLVQARRLEDGRVIDRFEWLPARETLDAVAHRAVIVGFPVFATMIVVGSWWASIAWSRWWGWDPKETSALVTWLVYAAYLHLRGQRGWRGRPAAIVLVVGFVMVLVTYSGNLWFPGLHGYSGL